MRNLFESSEKCQECKSTQGCIGNWIDAKGDKLSLCINCASRLGKKLGAKQPLKKEKIKVQNPYKVGNLIVSVVKDGSIPVDDRICDSPKNALELLRAFRPVNDQKEHFVAILCNSRNQAIAIHEVSVGTLSASLVHPREVFRPAILAGAAAIIVSHNHPSGDAAPSPEDKAATKRLKESGQMLGIPLLDHIVMADGNETFFSFRENGLLS